MSPSAAPTQKQIIALIGPPSLIQTVKEALSTHNKLDLRSTIQPFQGSSDKNKNPSSYLIPTTVTPNPELTTEESKSLLFQALNLENLASEIDYMITEPFPTKKRNNAEPKSNKLARTIYNWLINIPQDVILPHNTASDLVSKSRWSYTIYPPLFLLPCTAFASVPWPHLLSTTLKPYLPSLHTSICTAFHVSHLALDAPIPSQGTNILRSPSNLTPLRGDFGPALPPPPDYCPTAKDFERAFWCSTAQNGIVQIWAPRYTMFSRGNLSEKKRILELGALRGHREPRDTGLEEISAVDLYAGIGYFAFSYAKAGVRTVLCWELNPWSVEGLRRGAAENGWGCRISRCGEEAIEARNDVSKFVMGEERLLVFNEDNEKAAERIRKMRELLPPIRHVNCGLLPTSEKSWGVAVQTLDPVQGGWIHAHENVPVAELEHRKATIVRHFAALLHAHSTAERPFDVFCNHVESVKSYGPGINHCVFDIFIQPSSASH